MHNFNGKYGQWSLPDHRLYSLWKGCMDSTPGFSCEVRRQGCVKSNTLYLCCSKPLRCKWIIKPCIIYFHANICSNQSIFFSGVFCLQETLSLDVYSSQIHLKNQSKPAFYVVALPNITSRYINVFHVTIS